MFSALSLAMDMSSGSQHDVLTGQPNQLGNPKQRELDEGRTQAAWGYTGWVRVRARTGISHQRS
jgi:hypothetical protein